MEAWAGKLNGTSYVDETKAFNDLLGSKAFSNLTIGVLPSAVFPTADEVTKNSNSHLKVGCLSALSQSHKAEAIQYPLRIFLQALVDCFTSLRSDATNRAKMNLHISRAFVT